MVVYDVKTGEPLERESVDARELIASGAYSAEKEKPKTKKSAKSKDKAE